MLPITSLANPNPEPAGIASVFLVETAELLRHGPPWVIDGRPVRAFAPHPTCADLTYLTTDHPESLAFLPDTYIELD